MKATSWLVVCCVLLGLLAGLPAPVRAQDEAPDGVTLDYFTATASYPDYILLEWETVSEINTQAFRIKRGTTSNPAQAAVLIPYVPAHPGSLFGYYYFLQDSDGLVDGTTYYYWIEDEEFGQPNVWIAHPEYNPIVPWFACSIYDFDCSMEVDALDIAAAAERWNCSLGDPCYDATYDLNSDDQVDIIDIELDAARWGCQVSDACYG